MGVSSTIISTCTKRRHTRLEVRSECGFEVVMIDVMILRGTPFIESNQHARIIVDSPSYRNSARRTSSTHPASQSRLTLARPSELLAAWFVASPPRIGVW